MLEPDMVVYKNREEKKPTFSTFCDFEEAGVHETLLSINLHTGTHLDAPYHLLKEGARTDNFDPEKVIFPCRVLDLTELQRGITAEDLEKQQIEEGDFVVFKTRNSRQKEFSFDFIYLTEGGADYLVKKKIVGVGIDSLGIERDQPGHPTHRLLLANDILLVEGLSLNGVLPGKYSLLLAPLKIKGADAAPARVYLIQD